MLLFLFLHEGHTEEIMLEYEPFDGLSEVFGLCEGEYCQTHSCELCWKWSFTLDFYDVILIWIFLVLPMTIFVYWLYEPMGVQRWRQNLADKMAAKFSKQKTGVDTASITEEHDDEPTD